MTWLGMTTVNHYEALGIDRSASMEDIKKAHRRLAREYHPDVSDAATEEEKQAKSARFDEVHQAYEWLLANHVPRATTYRATNASGTEDTIVEVLDIDIIIEGASDIVPATLQREQDAWGNTFTYLYISLDNARRLQGFPEGEYIREVKVMDGETIVLRSGAFFFSAFKQQLRNYDDKQAAKRYRVTLNEMRAQAQKFWSEGRPANKLLDLIYKAERVLAVFGQPTWGSRTPKTEGDVKAALKAVQNELNRVGTAGVELFVDSLVDGSIVHPDITPNNTVIMMLKELSIRSNGFIEPMTEELLRTIYRRRIGNVTGFDELHDMSFRLSLEDYAPADILEELEPDLAPKTIAVPNGNSFTEYSVRYDTVDVDGIPVNVGVITIPLSLYQKNAAEYGKASKFPTLPYDIRLMLVVEKQGREVATGFDDDMLAARVKKFVKAASRGQRFSGTAAQEGHGIAGIYAPSQVPPWYKGQRIR